MPLNSIRVLSSGIDSLYVSFGGELRPEVAASLERAKASARDSGQGQPLKMSDIGKAVVQPSGWGRYRYWVRCDGFDIFMGSGASLPAAYVQLKSPLIHEVGPQNALIEAALFIDGPLLVDVGDVRCSRVDIYLRLPGLGPSIQ